MHTSQLMGHNLAAIRNEAYRIEEDCTCSSKGHFNAEDAWLKRNYVLGIPSTLLSAIAGAALFKTYPDWASGFALTASLLAGLMTFLKPNERAAAHRRAAAKYSALRNQVRIFREIEILNVVDIDRLRAQLKTLSATRDKYNEESPAIPRRAFEAARRGIEEGEATHRVDSNAVVEQE